jgi:hypothetical protein
MLLAASSTAALRKKDSVKAFEKFMKNPATSFSTTSAGSTVRSQTLVA